MVVVAPGFSPSSARCQRPAKGLPATGLAWVGYTLRVPRSILALLIGLLLVALATSGVETRAAAGLSQWIEAGASDCCPGSQAAPADVEDCCDYDLGLCCGSGIAALVPIQSSPLYMLRFENSDEVFILPAAIPQYRSNGPPPYPPPIA